LKIETVTALDINIDIADILGQKYQYCIDIGKGNIDPLLVERTSFSLFTSSLSVVAVVIA